MDLKGGIKFSCDPLLVTNSVKEIKRIPLGTEITAVLRSPAACNLETAMRRLCKRPFNVG